MFFSSFSRPPSVSTELTVSSSASAISGSPSHQLTSSGSDTTSKFPTDEALIRHPLSADLTLKSGDLASDAESDSEMSSPPSYELATESLQPILTSKPRSGLTGFTGLTGLRSSTTSAGSSSAGNSGSMPESETKVESEKPKCSLRNFSTEESSTDPIYSTDESVLGYGGSEILSDGLHRLEERLVQRLNNLDDVDPESFEPRPIVFNIPDVDRDSNPAPSSSSSNEAIVVLHIDTTTSVI